MAFIDRQALPVLSVSRSMVVPETPTKKHWMSLSNLDRVVNPTYVSLIAFYEFLLQENTYEEVVKAFKSSLSKVLVDFYPFAGELALRDDGLVDVHCNDQGAMFLEAYVDLKLSQAGGPRPMSFIRGLEAARIGNGPRFLPDQITSLPTLIVQLTRFKCGSVALSASWHHTICDGFSGTHFMNSWAEVASGRPISLQPCHERELLRPRPTLDPSLVQGYSTKVLKPTDCMAAVGGMPMVKTFDINRECVQFLKQNANDSDPDNAGQFSTAVSMSATLWQLMTRARHEDEKELELPETKTRFFTFVDGRKKLGLPAGFFGNVVASACIEGTEKDIASKPVGYIAGLIRNSIRRITGEYFRSLVDWVEQQDLESNSEHTISLGRDVAATFWTSFPLYKLDFGWGKPTYAGRNAPPRMLIDGISVMPSCDGGSLSAILNLDSSRMKRIEAIPEFTRLFQASSVA